MHDINRVLKIADQIGLSGHFSIREDSLTPDLLATIAYPPNAVNVRIPCRLLMEEDLFQVESILRDAAKMITNN